MAFTFVAAVGGNSPDAGTTLDASASLNVAAGDVLVGWCKHEGANGTFAIAKTTGGNDFTFDAGDENNHANGDLNGSMGYLLSASADATFTPRFTSSSRAFRRFIVAQFRPDSGETVTKDAASEGQGTSAAPNSGNITTTGDDEIAIGGFGEYTETTTATELINAVGATEPTGSPQASTTSLWYRILTATFTDGAASATITSSAWICSVIALKSTAAGGETAAFSSDGTGAATLSGASQASGALSITGTSTLTMTGASQASSALAAAGTGEATMTGASLADGAVAAEGVGEALLEGASEATGAMAMVGESTVEWVGASVADGQGAFLAEGVGDAQFEGASTASAELSADGVGDAQFVGEGGEPAPAPDEEEEPGVSRDGGAWARASRRERRRRKREDEELIEVLKALAPRLMRDRRTLH